MSKPYTGECACGAIRYEISAEPIAMNDCQCRDCQATSGTGHGSYLTFPSRAAVKLEGEATHWRKACAESVAMNAKLSQGRDGCCAGVQVKRERQDALAVALLP